MTDLLWECAYLHRWFAPPNRIIHRNHWCPQCSKLKPYTIQQMRELAEKKGGKCISEEYVNGETHLLWECENYHRWLATPDSIINQRSWCPQCSHSFPLTIGEMRAIASSRGGECISNEYINSHTKLQWKCSKGHIWSAQPSNIKLGKWCPTCGYEKNGDRLRLSPEYVKQKIEEKGMQWISGQYVINRSKLLVRCTEGHLWNVCFSNLIKGRHCPICSRLQRASKSTAHC
jgi:hypothetical protein